MYRTLLQTQLLGVENPHTITGGALNDNVSGYDGHTESVRLPNSHNILSFTEVHSENISPVQTYLPPNTAYPDY